MGAAQTQGVYTDIPLQHPYLKNCRALTKNKLTFLLSSVAVQKPQFLKWKEQLFEFQSQGSDTQWLMLPLKQKYEEGGVCSTSGDLKLQYEYYPKLLSTQIADRTIDKRKFNEAELWYLLYVLVTARQALVSQGYSYGDLQPRNVFLNANQQIKIGCILSWPGEVSAYRKVVLEEDFGYLSPQDIERLKLGAMDNKNNTDSQIFAIGLTLLSASSLQPMKDLYNIRKRSFDQQLFSTRLSSFQQDRTYSDIFRAVVSNLLEVDLLNRMNQKQLYQFLSKHKECLVIKKPLVFDNVGRKLQLSINQLLRIVPRLPPPQLLIQQTNRIQQSQPKDNPQQNLKRSASKTKKKRLSIAKTQLKKDMIELPISLRADPVPLNNISFNNQPSQPYIQQFPIQIPHSPRSLYPATASKLIQKQLNHQKPEPLQNTIKIQSQANQRSHHFSPFDKIDNKIDKSIKQTNTNVTKEHKVPIQANKNENIERKQPDSSHHSKINELKSECEQQSLVGQLNLLIQTRRGANVVQVVEIKRKSRGSQSKVSENSKLNQNSIINIKYQCEHIEQQPQQVKQIENLVVAHQPEQVNQHKQVIFKTAAFKDSSVIIEDAQLSAQNKKAQNSNNQKPDKSSFTSLPLVSRDKIIVEPTSATKTIVIQQQEDKNGKQLSPLIKVWGTQKGQLTKQQVSKPIPKNPQNQNQVAFSNKQITITQLKQLPKPAKSTAGNEVPIISLPEYQRSKQQIQSQPNIQPLKPKDQNYILIEQPSHSTDKEQLSKQVQSLQSNQNQHSESKAKRVLLSASQAKNRFIYIDIAITSSYQDCWKELQNLIQSPADYCSKIKPEKVLPRATQYGKYLKLGPARVKIDINKEYGKIWLQNIHGSLCQGQILCGVLKTKDMQHYIWFNSSYMYKGKHLPSRQVLEEALATAKRNIQNRLNTSQQK